MVSEHVEAESSNFLYRHYDVNGGLLYVGVSNDVDRRLVQHKRSAEWAADIADVKVEAFATRKDALLAERIAIEADQPKYNTTYKFPAAPGAADIPNEGAMTNKTFKAIRNSLRLTQAQLSRVLHYETALTVSTYERTTNPRPVPTHVALLMTAYAEGYRPKDWPA